MSKIEIFENQRAARYDQFVETWIPNYHYFMSLLPRLISPTGDRQLLVAGCGTGTEIKYLAQQSPEWSITGVDPSPEMIQQARERLKSFESIQLLEGLVTDLESDKKFDAATLILVLHFMPDDGSKATLLSSISERMKKDSPFVMLDITGSADQMKGNLDILRHQVPKHLPKGDVEERLRRIATKLHPVSEERLVKLFVDTGFHKPLRFFQNSIYQGWIGRKS